MTQKPPKVRTQCGKAAAGLAHNAFVSTQLSCGYWKYPEVIALLSWCPYKEHRSYAFERIKLK